MKAVIFCVSFLLSFEVLATSNKVVFDETARSASKYMGAACYYNFGKYASTHDEGEIKNASEIYSRVENNGITLMPNKKCMLGMNSAFENSIDRFATVKTEMDTKVVYASSLKQVAEAMTDLQSTNIKLDVTPVVDMLTLKFGKEGSFSSSNSHQAQTQTITFYVIQRMIAYYHFQPSAIMNMRPNAQGFYQEDYDSLAKKGYEYFDEIPVEASQPRKYLFNVKGFYADCGDSYLAWLRGSKFVVAKLEVHFSSEQSAKEYAKKEKLNLGVDSPYIKVDLQHALEQTTKTSSGKENMSIKIDIQSFGGSANTADNAGNDLGLESCINGTKCGATVDALFKVVKSQFEGLSPSFTPAYEINKFDNIAQTPCEPYKFFPAWAHLKKGTLITETTQEEYGHNSTKSKFIQEELGTKAAGFINSNFQDLFYRPGELKVGLKKFSTTSLKRIDQQVDLYLEASKRVDFINGFVQAYKAMSFSDPTIISIDTRKLVKDLSSKSVTKAKSDLEGNFLNSIMFGQYINYNQRSQKLTFNIPKGNLSDSIYGKKSIGVILKEFDIFIPKDYFYLYSAQNNHLSDYSFNTFYCIRNQPTINSKGNPMHECFDQNGDLAMYVYKGNSAQFVISENLRSKGAHFKLDSDQTGLDTLLIFEGTVSGSDFLLYGKHHSFTMYKTGNKYNVDYRLSYTKISEGIK
jgi:hypothetical protein